MKTKNLKLKILIMLKNTIIFYQLIRHNVILWSLIVKLNLILLVNNVNLLSLWLKKVKAVVTNAYQVNPIESLKLVMESPQELVQQIVKKVKMILVQNVKMDTLWFKSQEIKTIINQFVRHPQLFHTVKYMTNLEIVKNVNLITAHNI